MQPLCRPQKCERNLSSYLSDIYKNILIYMFSRSHVLAYDSYMKISEIKPGPQHKLSSGLTFIISDEAKEALKLIADTKGKKLSQLVREVIDDFLANNSDEIKKLVG